VFIDELVVVSLKLPVLSMVKVRNFDLHEDERNVSSILGLLACQKEAISLADNNIHLRRSQKWNTLS